VLLLLLSIAINTKQMQMNVDFLKSKIYFIFLKVKNTFAQKREDFQMHI